MRRLWCAAVAGLLVVGGATGVGGEEPVRLGPFTLGEITTTVTLDDTSIPGPPGFGDAPLIAWQAAHLDVDAVAFLRGATHVSEVRMEGPALTFVRNQDRAWNFSAARRSLGGGGSPEPDPAEAAADADADADASHRLAVDEIMWTAGTLTMVDHAVSGPPVTIVLSNFNLVMKDLIAPMAADHMDTTVDVTAAWGDAPASRLVVKARGNFLHAEKSFDLRATIHEAPLVLFSPYYSNRAVRIEGGVMDATIVGGCRANELDARVDVRIRNLQVRESGKNVAASIYGQTATQFVRLVQANGGNFDLSFPVKGSLSNPEFTVDAALGKQFAIAATSGIAAAADAIAKAGRTLTGRGRGEVSAPVPQEDGSGDAVRRGVDALGGELPGIRDTLPGP